jgi:hypothetical protein
MKEIKQEELEKELFIIYGNLLENSKDLDGEIVDMVNRKFKKLLLKIEEDEREISSIQAI